ncbi:hypothetical protein CDD81_342 [Ophiocordyceps australis]|uniref:Uncharacterized protein n=1 Tax=Ophiocordyceps australis TaxID=1399860 RepID=A0A2C5XW50_9HYPO|nr:hypothetical protein CDD81_342 [Ophiocordyceps australis]
MPVGDSLRISWPTYQNVCDCVLGNSKENLRHSAAMLVFDDMEDKTPIEIDVFVHVIATTRTSPLTEKYHNVGAYERELAEIFGFYNHANIKFQIKSIELLINQEWADGVGHHQMQQMAYMGNSRDLNIFFLDAFTLDASPVLPESPLVTCSFPFTSWWARLSGSEPEHDGCLIAKDIPPSIVASALQYWIGVHVPVSRSCKYVYTARILFFRQKTDLE